MLKKKRYFYTFIMLKKTTINGKCKKKIKLNLKKKKKKDNFI